MLLDPLDPTQSAILEVLAKEPGKTVKEIHAAITERGATISQPNLYRILGLLIEAKVVVKEKHAHSLNLTWVHTVMNFSHDLQKKYIESEHAVYELPKEGERMTIKESSLFDLDQKWDHLILELVNKHHCDEWFEYESHPWYALGMPDSDRDLYELLKKKEIQCNLLHGNDTFLDLHAMKTLGTYKGLAQTVSSKEAPFMKSGYLLIVYGPFIMELIMPPILTEHFSVFYESVESIDQFDADMFASVFRMKAPCTLNFRRNEKEAEELRTKMVPFFRESQPKKK